VDAVAEGDLSRDVASHVETIRLRELARVAVCGAEEQLDARPRGGMPLRRVLKPSRLHENLAAVRAVGCRAARHDHDQGCEASFHGALSSRSAASLATMYSVALSNVRTMK
jgi:hypothetical protein